MAPMFFDKRLLGLVGMVTVWFFVRLLRNDEAGVASLTTVDEVTSKNSTTISFAANATTATLWPRPAPGIAPPPRPTTTFKNAPKILASPALAPVTTSSMSSREALKETQLENYRNGTGLILNLHITHHGGTAFCQTVGRSPHHSGGGTSPSFACMGDNNNVSGGIYQYNPTVAPWQGPNQTAEWIAKTRPFFHMISWEYGHKPPPRDLHATHWEDPHLVSVLVVRHPVDRLLGRDATISRLYPGLQKNDLKHDYEQNATLRYQYWWDYANGTSIASTRNSNNFALWILSNPKTCCHGHLTNRTNLELAKSLVSRFTIVLDQACLDDGMTALGIMLNMTLDWKFNRHRDRSAINNYKRPSYRDRIGFDDVYEFLLEKNRLDIELYEWAKTISLVRCKEE